MPLLRSVSLEGQSFSPRRRTVVMKCGGAAPGRRRPHSSTAFAVATRHFSRFPFCSLLYVRAWLSARPCRPATQQAGKAANQEAATHCGQQTLKNMTELLFESKIHLSHHNIGLESSLSRSSLDFSTHFTKNIGLKMSNISLYDDNPTMRLGRPLQAKLNRPTI